MAVKRHVDRLQRGVAVWNTWRKKHPENEIDLSDADLSGAHLSRANLCGAHLSRANLCDADLRDADLCDADLCDADLRDADLCDADLSRAHLSGANLSGADLRDADLRDADLRDADLSRADLRDADLSRANLCDADLRDADLSKAHLRDADLSDATIGWTSFGDQDLRVVKGLETINQRGPSSLSINTIYQSEGDLPEVFVRGTGAPDTFLEYMHALARKPIEYYTCFISYSSKDETFAKRLYADLQSRGVRCWFAPHSMRPGTVIVRGIDEAIRLYDKLLLVLSEHSVESTWVEFEVAAALEKEKEQRKEMLFPIRLDNAVLTTQQAWAAGIRRQRHIDDFTQWKDHDTYQHIFDRLLHHLKTSAAKESH